MDAHHYSPGPVAWTRAGLELGSRALRRFLSHDMPTYAAALAYRGLLALFPFVIFLMSPLLGLTSFRKYSNVSHWSLSSRASSSCGASGMAMPPPVPVPDPHWLFQPH